MREFPELSLEEMLADPIVRAVMAADGVDPAELSELLRSLEGRDSTTRRRTRV